MYNLYLTSCSNSLFRIIKTLDPIGVKQRAYSLNRLLKGKYVVPRPDYIQSINGHDKLKEQGIKIYARIDAYSQYIVQIYIRVSNRSTTSVLL